MYDKDIKRFLNEKENENPELYDFKDEIFEEAQAFYNEIREIHDINQYIIKDDAANKIRRFLQYTESLDTGNPIKKLYITNIYALGKVKCDCDSSDGSYALTNEIYDRLWGWHFDKRGKSRKVPDNLKEKLGHKWGNMELGSDTMNSFKTTYDQAIIIEATKQKINLDQYKTQYGYNRMVLIKDYPSVLRVINGNTHLQRYALLTHTIGNFTLIPNKIRFADGKWASFQSRGILLKDYWDLSLDALQNFLNGSLSKVADNSFERYVDTFYLNDYIEHGTVKQLFTRQEGHILPQTEDELNEFLQNVNHLIILRGKKIVDELNALLRELGLCNTQF